MSYIINVLNRIKSKIFNDKDESKKLNEKNKLEKEAEKKRKRLQNKEKLLKKFTVIKKYSERKLTYNLNEENIIISEFILLNFKYKINKVNFEIKEFYDKKDYICFMDCDADYFKIIINIIRNFQFPEIENSNVGKEGVENPEEIFNKKNKFVIKLTKKIDFEVLLYLIKLYIEDYEELFKVIEIQKYYPKYNEESDGNSTVLAQPRRRGNNAGDYNNYNYNNYDYDNNYNYNNAAYNNYNYNY